MPAIDLFHKLINNVEFSGHLAMSSLLTSLQRALQKIAFRKKIGDRKAEQPIANCPGPNSIVKYETADIFSHLWMCEEDRTDNKLGELNGRAILAAEITAGQFKRQLFYRADSIGDIGVQKQIFREKQYDFHWIPQWKWLDEFATTIVLNDRTPAIIDAGANIGASSVWFAGNYPQCVVVAIEPELDNFDLAKVNCRGLPIQLLRAALADRRRTMFLTDPGQSDWAFRVEESGNIVVQCIGMEDLIGHLDARGLTPYILKLDIEGSEEQVFSGNCAWLRHIPVLIIELHDWLFPEKRTSAPFVAAMSKYGFQLYTRGENIFCFNIDLLRSSRT